MPTAGGFMPRISVSLFIVALLATPALADKKKKGGGEEAAPPPPPPAEPEKKNKKKDKAEEAPAPAPAPPEASAGKKKKDKAEEAPAAPPAPAPPGTTSGNLKPGQAVGVQQCLGSSQNVNVNATSKDTYGIAHCRSALQKAFIEKGLCAKLKGKKLDYSWQFADTTGQYAFTCP
jgi:hypothetical protein